MRTLDSVSEGGPKKGRFGTAGYTEGVFLTGAHDAIDILASRHARMWATEERMSMC